MTHPVRLDELTPAEARERLAVTRRLIVPAGTLEFRGAHLPLGTDSIILERLADDLSLRVRVPRTPTIAFGVHARGDESGPGVAALSRKTLHRVMNELIQAWEEGAGVREVVVLTAHAAEAHQEALAGIRAAGRVIVIDIFGLAFGNLLERPGPFHGGELDTSLIMFLRPGLVKEGEVVASLGASAEKGRALYLFMLDRVTELCFPVEELKPS